MSNDPQTALVFSFLQFLSRIRVEKQEQIDLSIQVLSDAFQIDINDPRLREKYEFVGQDILSITNAGVEQLNVKTLEEEKKELEEQPLFQQFLSSVSGKYFQGVDPNSNEYYDRYVKLVKKFKERNIKSAPAPVNNEEEGERLKNLGNEALKNKDYQSAIDYYSRAIEVCPSGSNAHIYYSNRAAVYSLRGDHASAVVDCEKAISFKSDFSKAYSRLGSAQFYLGNYEKAKEAYLRTLELDPQNSIAREFLTKTEEKLQSESGVDDYITPSIPENIPRTGRAPQGANPLETLMQNPEMMEMAQKFMGQNGGAGGAGGPGGMQELLQNPAMMQMAQQMMQNPQMMQQMMSMLGGGAQRK